MKDVVVTIDGKYIQDEDEQDLAMNFDPVSYTVNGTINDPINDPINHPSHYTHGSIESIDLMEECEGLEAVKHFCICNCHKYLYRHNTKGRNLEDIRKMVWYANKYIELCERENDVGYNGPVIDCTCEALSQLKCARDVDTEDIMRRMGKI